MNAFETPLLYVRPLNMRKERLPKLVINWTSFERRKGDRSRATWLGKIQKAMSERKLNPEDWEGKEELGPEGSGLYRSET